ncbi:MAG: hypothetical protein RLY57_306 [Candidatus Parcubacteria bacterium]|jgi:hypothetical protein
MNILLFLASVPWWVWVIVAVVLVIVLFYFEIKNAPLWGNDYPHQTCSYCGRRLEDDPEGGYGDMICPTCDPGDE